MSELRTGGVASPCIGLCRLNEASVCLGCYRHIDEIRDWGLRPETERLQILQRCARRRQAAQRD